MNIENKKQIAIILLAVGLGIVAAVLTGNYIQTSIQGATEKLSKEYETKQIKPLRQEMAAMQAAIQKIASRPATVVAPPAGGQSGKPEAGAIPKSSLALRTPAGKRAYTVRIDSLSAVGGLVNPGDYVDIIGHMNIPNPVSKQTENVSTIIFQNIQILAVGTNLQSPGGYEQQQNARALNITFALTPEEAGLMSFIEMNGKMQLILRAPAETETQTLQTATWKAVADYVYGKQGTELNVPRKQAVIEPVLEKEEPKPFIQIFRGGREL
jgi:hypothetical protein